MIQRQTVCRLALWLILWFSLIGPMSARADLIYSLRPDSSSPGSWFLVVEGIITKADDIEAFAALATSKNVDAVTFNSPGGSVYKGMELGRRIRHLNLNTFQTGLAECASACALAFLGGVARSAEPGSIGVHRTGYADDPAMKVRDAVSAIQKTTGDMIGYLVEMGADPALLQVALAYESTDMRFLSGSEMEKYRVVTLQRGADEPIISLGARLPAMAPIPMSRSRMRALSLLTAFIKAPNT